MDSMTRKTMQGIMTQLQDWGKTLADQSEKLDGPQATVAFEKKFRDDGLQMLGSVFEALMQNAVDHQPQERTCPQCGKRRRHKGRRQRGLLSSVGAIRLQGVYWYCSDCGGQHAADALVPQSSSGPMQHLLCLLGTSMASFAKASFAGEKLLGIRVSDNTIRRLCYDHGGQVGVSPVSAKPKTDVVGSCDGTMINTRQDGWRELKAYQFRYDSNRHGRAYLESADRFTPRLRKAAAAIIDGDADRRMFWVSDAAKWIDNGVRTQLPMAIRIIDIWHAYQHIHEASRGVYPDDENKARQWAKRYCEVLEEDGGRVLCRRLRHAGYAQAERQAAVNKLRKYLRNNVDRLRYPHYKREGYPISSGPMESFCKQLGQRLKGPGMRWNIENVATMANLVSLWSNEEWDRHWKTVA